MGGSRTLFFLQVLLIVLRRVGQRALRLQQGEFAWHCSLGTTLFRWKHMQRTRSTLERQRSLGTDSESLPLLVHGTCGGMTLRITTEARRLSRQTLHTKKVLFETLVLLLLVLVVLLRLSRFQTMQAVTFLLCSLHETLHLVVHSAVTLMLV